MKHINLFSLMMLAFAMLIAFPASLYAQNTTTEQDTAVTIEVTADQMKSMGARKTIQKALNVARDHASSNLPYIIKIEPGTYTLTDGTLYIYSYTTLDLTDVTLERSKPYNMIHVGKKDAFNDESGVTGYFYKNITILNGKLDASALGGTVVKCGHAANFSMLGTTLSNVKDGHLMEVAATDGFFMKDCTLQDQIIDPECDLFRYEMIQLDILVNDHLIGYRSEALPLKNISIDHCSFSNAPRGIGSHTSILNAPVDGISITNCSFSNMSSAAIQGQDWINCNISNNNIAESPRGIVLYSIFNGGQGCYPADVIATEGNTQTTIPTDYMVPSMNQNILISNNVICLNDHTDPYVSYARGAIIISGSYVFEPFLYRDGSGSVPSGNYYISGISITSNAIQTTGHGIRLIDCQNTFVDQNYIFSFSSPNDSSSYFGIQAKDDSTGIVIMHNIIKYSISTGIYISNNSFATSISYNTISHPGKCGIGVEESHAAYMVYNTIRASQDNGIFLYNDASAGKIKHNTISSGLKSGIYIMYGSKADMVSYNMIKKCSLYGIAVNEYAKISNMVGNSLTGCSNYAVYHDLSSTIALDSKNFACAAPQLLSVAIRKNDIKFTWKKVSGAKTYYIYRRTSSKDSWKKIGSSRTTSYVDTKVKSGSVYYYTVKVVENGTVRSDYDTKGLRCFYLASPAITKRSSDQKTVTVKWTKVSNASGYIIQYSSNKDFSKYKSKKCSSSKSLTKTITKLKSNKKYYIRICAYYKSGSSTYKSTWSSVKWIKTKKVLQKKSESGKSDSRKKSSGKKK